MNLADERFVLLTTFRRTGEPMSTPVWIAGDGADLIVTTPTRSGKVKRLRNNPVVEVQPCSRRGTVEPGAPKVRGTAEILSDRATRRFSPIFRRKYGLEYKIFMAVERLVTKSQDRRILRIALDGPTVTP